MSFSLKKGKLTQNIPSNTRGPLRETYGTPRENYGTWGKHRHGEKPRTDVYTKDGDFTGSILVAQIEETLGSDAALQRIPETSPHDEGNERSIDKKSCNINQPVFLAAKIQYAHIKN